MNVERLTDAKREIWSGRDGSRGRTGRNGELESACSDKLQLVFTASLSALGKLPVDSDI